MIFFPYKADLDLHRIPFFTVLVSILCIAVFHLQATNEKKVKDSIVQFCSSEQPRMFRLAMSKLYRSNSPRKCADFMVKLHLAKDKNSTLEKIIRKGGKLSGLSRKDSDKYISDIVLENYGNYKDSAPDHLTNMLWYKPHSWDPVKMITAAFAHGSWGHVIGNLVFFFAFAATIEVIVGYVLFPLLLLSIAVFSHIVYSVTTIGIESALPTVGLSGVVSGIMALFVFFLPRADIRCFVWVLVFFRRFGIPAWLFVGFFVGWDIYYLFSNENNSNINFAAHIGGAVFGYMLGIVLFQKRRDEIKQLSCVDYSTGKMVVGYSNPQQNQEHWSKKKVRKW